MPENEQITPLNHIDDPFAALSDKEVAENGLALQEQLVLNLIIEDLQRGMYSVGRLREKYLGTPTNKPYPWLTVELLSELLAKATERLVDDNPVDLRFEVTGYLASNLQLQESLYVMLDANSTKPHVVDKLINTINKLKTERLAFLREQSKEIAAQAVDPTAISALPPGAIPHTDLLAQGAEILERTSIPDNFTGVLESGILAEDRRSESTAGEMEEQQDPVDTAGLIPG